MQTTRARSSISEFASRKVRVLKRISIRPLNGLFCILSLSLSFSLFLSFLFSSQLYKCRVSIKISRRSPEDCLRNSLSLRSLKSLKSFSYGVATISRLLKIIGLFCKKDLQMRPIFSKETYNFKQPTNRSHPILNSLSHKERLNSFFT